VKLLTLHFDGSVVDWSIEFERFPVTETE